MNNDLMMAVLSMAAYKDPKIASDVGFATKLNIELPAGSDSSVFLPSPIVTTAKPLFPSEVRIPS
jgi:hypothetical protein